MAEHPSQRCIAFGQAVSACFNICKVTIKNEENARGVKANGYNPCLFMTGIMYLMTLPFVALTY